MSTLADTQAALRRAAAVIQRLERRIVEAEDARTEPIAIIGASCRLPGSVTNLDEFWQLLESGRDSLTAIPAERFDLRTVYDADPEASGKSYVRSGAFLDNVDHFDAAFFGLSPRETNWIDPQHRLFVECTWEALERAGISGRVHGAQVGVYLGIGPSDYAHHLSFASAEALEGYLVTGTGSSFSAGRVSYLLGLHGPAVAIDTACSSSLVAIHLACNALRTRDCEVAVAGGVQVLLSPEPFILLSRLRALAPDGRCKTFSNHADGYGRGEGCGVLVLKRLSDAKRSGDPILALIRGSAINHDGASSGFTTPNGRAQKAVIQAALKNAHVEPRDVQYVEAHGTGTALGDPIEVEALAESYGDGRSDALRVGALKANIGHLESAAGVAGVLKILAALHNEALPRSLHAQPLSTHIDWQSMPVEVVLEQEGWPRSGTPRIAGVSAFGMSGTNAHLVLEEAPVVDPTPVAPERSAELIVLTAKTPEALTASAARLREHLERQQELRLGDVAYSLVTTRSLMDHRLTLSVPSREALLEALRGVERGEAPAGAVWGQARQQRGKLAWLLTGQGAQQLGMGRGLYAEWPAFRQALDEVFGLFDAQLERPLREIMWAEAGTADAALLDQTGYTQPALFALEWALAQLWRSWGVEPDLLLGHSIGEITAACIAGVFSLADAVRLVGARARLMQGLSKGGAMVSIAAPESEVSGVVKGYAQTVSLAALNGLSSTVIAGTEADVLAVAQSFSARGAATKRLPVSHAFHSPLMDPMLEDFRRVAQSIEYHAQQIPIVANVSGQLAGREIQQAQYWVRQVRDTVRFSQGLRSLEAAGAKSFLELGPKPTLIGLLPATLEEPALLLPSLRGGRSEPRAVLEALGGWAAQGGSVTWEGVFPSGGRRVELPTYAWQRQRYWIDGVNSSPEQSGEHGRWPLSGSRRELPHDALHHILKVGTQLQSFLGDHVVYGVVVVPGAFFVSALLAAAAERWPDEQLDVENVEFLEALRLEEDQTLDLHLILQPGSDDASMSAEVATHSTRTSAWKTHVRARIALAKDPLGSMPSLSELLPATRPTDPSALLAKLSAVHIDWGPQWYWLTRAWISGASTMVELTPPSGSIAPVAPLHPVLLDNGFASFVLLAPVAGTEDTPRLPFAIRRIRWLKAPTGVVRCSARLTPTSTLNSEVVSLDLAFWDESGDVLAVVEQFSIRQAPKNLFLREQEDPAEHPQCLYRLEWTPSSISETPRNNGGTWLVVGERDSFELKLVAALEASGVRVICVASAEALRSAGNTAPINGVIWLSNSNERAPAAEARRLCIEALAVVQALSSWQAASRLWWVTQGAVAVDVSEDVSPAASALWGLGRTVMMEQPELRCTLVDLDGEATADALLRELIAADDESQVAWRKGRRHVARLVRASSASAVPASDNYQLATQQKGALDSLSLVAAPRRAPGAGEVELRIHASGLNFRDVLNALGMYPGEAGPLGGECSGVVTGVGAGVSSVAVGDWVMGLAPGAFRRYATMDARWVTTVPQGLSFEEAASLPIVFLTAWYALHDLARLKRGERVLIHAAAGGVGMAAVQLAQWIGAEVLATASPSKWDVLRSLGVRQFGSSRDLSFAENFRSLAGGAHVVLNALTGDFIDASLSLLSAGGRFIEMGKADIRDSSEVAAAHPGVSYQAFDLTQVDPNRIAEMLAEVKRGIESGHLKPLPVRTFRITQAEAAFRFMAQARHVGKILLLPPATMFSADGTVLITGGLGALGLAVARRCAERGVEHLVLTGRRGRETPGAAEAVAELEAQGAKVKVASVDVSDREALARVLGAIPAQYPLRGVVHAAGLIDDGLLVEQTPERLSNVLSPKVDGAIHLDELTRGVPLDFFVMFSSVAGTLGSAAQGAYAAGNAFLDALATHRRTLGLPGLSLAWGPWAQSGMAAALDSKLQARFARQGISMLSTSEGLSLFESVLGRSESQLVVVPLDLRRLGKALGSSIPSVWRSLVRSSSLGSPAAGGSWSRELSALAAGARLEAVTEAVRTEVARVLSLPSPTQVPLDRPLQELGLDSLMAVELRNALGRRAGVTLPATLAFDHPTSAAIAKHLLADVLKLTEGKQALPSVAPAGASDEPIAIVGIGCRFPGGVTDPESLWRLLEQGVDAITEVPKDRWDIDEWYDPDPDAAGKMTTRWGGFLRDLDRFEPSFFGISPGEALSIDPQERLLLETTWEALEHAGIRAETLMGSATGVYMGLCGNEYQARVMADAKSIDAYALLGTAHSTIVGRLSYWLGLKGPNLPIDTACSSSLVAVHLACQALRASECQLALAGGANVILNPEGTVYFSRLHAMSPSGRCHTFSADADGYVRSEGAGVVVLERLSDALKHGHRVWSIIRGSAVNQDGRSNGLTAPNGPSQQAVIFEALRRGGVEPARVGYVECHGTGTPLGDPIEVQALAAALSEGRLPGRSVWIGSLKSNLGHTEGAAGVGGLIKAALTLRHGRIPQSLHFARPNPHIAWTELPVQVAHESVEWLANGGPRIAGVSSFGISGTNAHVVLEEPPAVELPAAAPVRAAELCMLSARTSEALSSTARLLREHLVAHPELTLGDVAYSLVTTRSLQDQRLSISATSRSGLLDALQQAARGQTPVGVQRGTAVTSSGKLAWLFTGQGAQQLGMGRELYAEWPAFREALDGVCALLDPLLEAPLREVMWAEPGSARAALLDQTGFTQPALFAVEWALACLWRSWGVEPDLVLGHSIGQITAATVAGVLTLTDAVRLVSGRARLMQGLPAGGAMVSLAVAEAEALESIQPFRQTVALAAVNGPASVVIAGKEADVSALAERFESRGVPIKRLSVSHAFHSPLMDPMLAAFRTVAESITYQPARIPLVADTTGVLAGADISTPEYWVRHVRETVRFAPAIEALVRAGADTFLELGPRPTLLGLVAACKPKSAPTLLAALRPSRSEAEAALDALGGWVVRGGLVDWKGVFPSGGRCIPLPTYPWQRQRYWVDDSRRRAGGSSTEIEALLRQLDGRGRLSAGAHAALPDILTALAADRAATDPDGAISSWFHALSWRPIPPTPPPIQAGGGWAVLGAREEAETLGAALQRAGRRPYVTDLEHLSALLESPGGIDGVVYVSAPTGDHGSQVLAVERVLALNRSAPRAWWVTRGAVGTSPEDPPVDPLQSVVWGLGRTFALEHPKTWGGLLDLPQGSLSDPVADRVVALLVGSSGEDQLAVRTDQVFVPRIVPHELARSHSMPISGRGTALITGGLGALGLQVAHWLVRCGVRHLLLVSRHGLATSGARDAVTELQSLGVHVTVAAAHVADRDAMRQVIQDIPLDAPLSSVFHIAGIIDFTPLDELTSERLANVLVAKREGTLVLDELTRGQPLEAFVCFSSIAGVWGAGGQAAYAAANVFLDAWAHAARAAGRPAYSISWGPWAEGGMADTSARAQLERRGLYAMQPQLAIHALERALSARPAHSTIVHINWQLFRRAFEAWGPRSLLLEIGQDSTEPREPNDASSWVRELSALSREGQRTFVVDVVRGEVARILSLPDLERVPRDRGLSDLGLDSLMLVELRSALSRRTGMLLPATLAFDQPSPETIAEHLVPEPFTETRPVEAHASAISADSPTTSREVAHCERLSHLNAGSRLFCFHDAGGAASMFLPLVQMAGAGVEIHTISHNRLAPPDSQRGRQYLKAAVAYVRSLSDRPYAFFGHSVGALLAWRVAQEIVEGGGLQPLFLAPSGAPPVTPVEGFALDVSIVMDALLGARTVVTPASLASFQSDFATDLALWQMLPPTSKRPFPIPIAAFLGSEDTFVTQPAMKTWGGQTTRDFSITVLPGDHFYPHRKELQQALAKELARAFFDASFSSITHDELATRRIGRERKVAIEP